MALAADHGSVTDSSRVRLHPLRGRVDGSAWVLGRVDTGEFIAAPAEGHRAIELLGSGLCVGDVRACLRAETGEDFDVSGFVEELIPIGFVAALNDDPLEQLPPPRPTFAWLHPRHVAWTVHPFARLAVAAIIIPAVAMLVARPALLPSYHDLVWNQRGALSILTDATIGWAILMLHELGHLCTARAAGVPGRITLGTRLQFLVAQTDVSGIWASPRRIRVTVYLAGLAVNLALASAAILTRALIEPGPTIAQLLAAAAAISLLTVPMQFLLFMRTDLYFLLQDLTGARNLYADGSSYLRYRADCLRHPLRGCQRPDPSRALPPNERRAVIAYSPLLLLGTVGCLAAATVITVPATATILGNAIHMIFRAHTTGGLSEAATTLLVIGIVPLLWVRAWWRRHSGQLRAALRLPSIHPDSTERR